MTMNNKLTVILWAIMALSMTGCTCNIQAGKTNVIESRQTRQTTKFSVRYPNGRSLQDAIKDKVNGVKYD